MKWHFSLLLLVVKMNSKMQHDITISVQENDFSVAELYQSLTENDRLNGAVANFVGRVRASNNSSDLDTISSLSLEHYPGMTEKSLFKIAEDAKTRWPLGKIIIVHRVGKMFAGDQIVFVGVTSPHRKVAFKACEYIMDILKTQAPFWKKETSSNGEQWVDAKQTDNDAALKWL